MRSPIRRAVITNQHPLEGEPMFSPVVHEIPSARADHPSSEPVRIVRPEPLTRAELREWITDGFRYLMEEPSYLY